MEPFVPFAAALNTIDPTPELLFPEGFPGSETADITKETINNSAEKAGYLDRHLANLQVPMLYSYPLAPSRKPSASVLICPGGGYQILAIDKEGHDLARFFNSFGVAAFVLKYHSSGTAKKPGLYPDAPLRDAQRALRLIRHRAVKDSQDKALIGIMGFSAGAHLAASASTLFHDNNEKTPELKKISSRPDFSILIYPVITMLNPERHPGSAQNLLGKNASEELKRYFSPELQVSKETPPAFLVQAADDAVSVKNSLNYYAALHEAGIPATMHLYPEGGHGYGMRQRGLLVDNWPEQLKLWLKNFCPESSLKTILTIN